MYRSATSRYRLLFLIWLHLWACVVAGITRWPWLRSVQAALLDSTSSHTLASSSTTTSDSADSCNSKDSVEQLLKASFKETDKNQFHVQGWRWHTLSFLREAGRLQKLAQRSVPLLQKESSTNAAGQDLYNAVDYVIGFNLQGLHRIERDLFFPWLRHHLSAVPDATLARALKDMMKELEDQRQRLETMGKSVVSDSVCGNGLFIFEYMPTHRFAFLQTTLATVVSNPEKSLADRSHAAQSMSQQTRAMVQLGHTMWQLEASALVPAVARFVTESQQKSFNNRVIRQLGVWDSRLHLVGMYEAVWALPNPHERELFAQAIPYVPRKMIPRWKRLLYDPRVQALNQVS
jgi:hypothetical protein